MYGKEKDADYEIGKISQIIYIFDLNFRLFLIRQRFASGIL